MSDRYQVDRYDAQASALSTGTVWQDQSQSGVHAAHMYQSTSSECTLDHPVNLRTPHLFHHDLLSSKQQRHNRPCAQDQKPSCPPAIWCDLQQ